MLDSEFWRNLAEQFRRIDPRGVLVAEWAAVRESHWELRYGQFAAYAAQFEPLARRGGMKLNSTKDSLEVWLESMRNEGIYHTEEMTSGGSLIACTIPALCTQSANFCNRLESLALEAERLQQQRISSESAALSTPSSLESSAPFEDNNETVGEQIDRLRDECVLSIEELAEEVKLHPTNVSRHINNLSSPTRKNLAKYSNTFSRLLKRRVVIRKTQPKRS